MSEDTTRAAYLKSFGYYSKVFSGTSAEDAQVIVDLANGQKLLEDLRDSDSPIAATICRPDSYAASAELRGLLEAARSVLGLIPDETDDKIQEVGAMLVDGYAILSLHAQEHGEPSGDCGEVPTP